MVANAPSVQETQLVVPDVTKAKRSMELFNQLKRELLSDDDLAQISGKQYVKRSGFRKIALAFNLSTEIVSVERERLQLEGWSVRVKARATAPNGRISEDIAACDGEEIKKNKMDPTLHNVESKAATRALNRAISDLIGGGLVSAEEISPGVEQRDHQLSQNGDNSQTPGRTQEPNFSKRMTWKVRESEFPIPPEEPPYKSLLRTKVIPSLTSKDNVRIEEELVGGHVAALKIGSPDLTTQAKVLKDLTSAVEWALRTINKCSTQDIKVTVE